MSRNIDDEKLSNWYNFQARFYHCWRDDYRSPVIDLVAERLGSVEKPATILDAGCGTGMFAIGLARTRPAWTVEGLDAAEGMLEVARRQAETLRTGQYGIPAWRCGRPALRGRLPGRRRRRRALPQPE